MSVPSDKDENTQGRSSSDASQWGQTSSSSNNASENASPQARLHDVFGSLAAGTISANQPPSSSIQPQANNLTSDPAKPVHAAKPAILDQPVVRQQSSASAGTSPAHILPQPVSKDVTAAAPAPAAPPASVEATTGKPAADQAASPASATKPGIVHQPDLQQQGKEFGAVLSTSSAALPVSGTVEVASDRMSNEPSVAASTGQAPVQPATPASVAAPVSAKSAAPATPGLDDLPMPKQDAAINDNRSEARSGSDAGAKGVTSKKPARDNRSVLQKRSSDKEFRDILSKGLAKTRRSLVTVAIFSFVVNILMLAMPIYLFQLSDRVYTSRSVDTLIMLSIIVVGAVLGHVVLDMLRRYILMRVAVEVESKLGAPVLSAAAKASQSGSIREFQILGDLQHMRNFLTGPVLLTMLDAPASPIYLVAVFLVHPDIGLIVSGTGIALLVVAWLNQRLTAVPFAQANAFATRANLQADALARNSQVLNAMGMIPEGVRMWGRETAESLKAQVVAQDKNVLMTGLSKFIRLLTQVAILGWGAWLSLHGELTGGLVIAASIVGSRALAPLEGTIEGWRSFIQARTAYARIKTLLQNSPLNLERLQLPRPQGRLTVERVLYVPPPNKRVILNGINFELEPGELLGIVGASGSGKSTLARMLVGSFTPTAGNIRLDSMDLRNWDPRQFGESVGYLPQDVQLFPATIKANIARMREDATDEAIFEAAEIADVHEMISKLAQGYETPVSIDGFPLSGGQKQRIGLARAFFGDPRLVVLDEPNSNLDSPGEAALAAALLRAKERKITVVAITQRPAMLRSVDKIMVIKDGSVQAFGKRDEIIPLISGRSGKAGAASEPSFMSA